MLAEIESGIVQRIAEKVSGLRDVDVKPSHAGLITPAVFCVIGGGSFKRVAQSYKIEASIFLTIEFQNLKGEKERRAGIYPIFLAVVSCLILQNLGLAITPLVPVRFENITSTEEVKAGKIAFELELETAWVIEKLDDEAVADLLRIGLNYYLTPGDDVADATDLLTLQTP